MKHEKNTPYPMNSISELHKILELPKPLHPLISLINFEDIKCYSEESLRSVAYNFYGISIKRGFEGKIRYGQNYYDFDEGVMTFISPGQILTTELDPQLKLSGWWLVFHPDFLRSAPLQKTIKEFGYFSYAVNEALHLSENEEKTILSLLENIQSEYASRIDQYSQNVMISQIETLLNYCDRFYNRQFITRKPFSNDLLTRLEVFFDDYFKSDKILSQGLPTVQQVSTELNLSSHYLSDMLRSLTGHSTQQHIHLYLIERSKEMLTNSSLTVSEIAYALGFGHPQSFNKFFKMKTNLSPLTFRASFN